MRILDTHSWAPMIGLEQGTVIVEVTESRVSPILRIQVAGTTTQLLSPGVYEIDAQSGSLSLYRGDSETTFPGGGYSSAEWPACESQETNAGIAVRSQGTRFFIPLGLRNASFRLYSSKAIFMTGWGTDFVKAKHKVFGERSYFGPPSATPLLRISPHHFCIRTANIVGINFSRIACQACFELLPGNRCDGAS